MKQRWLLQEFKDKKHYKFKKMSCRTKWNLWVVALVTVVFSKMYRCTCNILRILCRFRFWHQLDTTGMNLCPNWRLYCGILW